MVKTLQLWTGNFTTEDATGAPVTPSVGPVGALHVAGLATGDVVTISNDGTVGKYKFSVTLPALTAGQSVAMYITATIATIPKGAFVAQDVGDTSNLSDIETLVDGIEAKTNNLPSDPADQSLLEAAITAATVSLATPAGVWTYASRTLTQSAAQVAAAVAGSTITIQRGDTVVIALTGLGSIADYVTLDFTAKISDGDADTAAIFRVRKNLSGLTDGLITLNGATATTATDASIVIDDSALGNITITLKASMTDDLTPVVLRYDVQKISSTAVKTLTEGPLAINGDVTRAVV